MKKRTQLVKNRKIKEKTLPVNQELACQFCDEFKTDLHSQIQTGSLTRHLKMVHGKSILNVGHLYPNLNTKSVGANSCKMCGKSIKKKRKYCSNACKFGDPDYNKSRGREVEIVIPDDALRCPLCDWFTKGEKDRRVGLATHLRLIHDMSVSEVLQEFPDYAGLFPNQVEEEYDGIVCLECGETMKKLTETHLQSHNMNTEEYKNKHGVSSILGKTSTETQRLRTLSRGYKNLLEKLKEIDIEPLFTLDEYLGYKHKHHFRCVTCSHEFEQILDGSKLVTCKYCNPNKELAPNGKLKEEVLKEFSIFKKKILINDQTVLTPPEDSVGQRTKEIDFWFPDQNVGVEYHGIYWHQEKYAGKHKHRDKAILATEKGIHLFQIFEDEWNYKKDIVMSRIRHALGLTTNKIGARKCEIREVTNIETQDFLNTNHIQGHANASICFGAFYKDELVSVMTFGPLRKALGTLPKTGSYEMIRFASSLDTSVSGIAKRLFKTFIEKYDPQYIKSFADARWSSNINNVYRELGFEYSGHTKANYWYVKGTKRTSRFNHTKGILVKQGHNPNKSETQIMQELGYYRIFDAGNYKYEWKPNNIPQMEI